MRLPAELRPQDVTALIDTREQLPLCLSPLRVETATLVTGDFSVKGLENFVAIERKSLGDLLSVVGRERARFDREVKRLLAYETRALLIEATWYELESGTNWPPKCELTPSQVVGSVLGWIAAGLPCLLVGDHERAGTYCSRLLYCAARRRWRECRALAAGVMEEAPTA